MKPYVHTKTKNMNVCVIFICSSVKLETSQMSTKRWTNCNNRHTMEYLPAIEKSKPLIHTPAWQISKSFWVKEVREKESIKSVSLFIFNFRNCKLICRDTKQINGRPGMRVKKGAYYEGLHDSSGTDGNVCYFNCGNDFTGAYMCHNSLTCAL